MDSERKRETAEEVSRNVAQKKWLNRVICVAKSVKKWRLRASARKDDLQVVGPEERWGVVQCRVSWCI